MQPKTIETITRHLKGIVAALDKEKDKTAKQPKDMLDGELKDEYAFAMGKYIRGVKNPFLKAYINLIIVEIGERSIDL